MNPNLSFKIQVPKKGIFHKRSGHLSFLRLNFPMTEQAVVRDSASHRDIADHNTCICRSLKIANHLANSHKFAKYFLFGNRGHIEMNNENN